MESFKLENSLNIITFPAAKLHLETFTLLHPRDVKAPYGGAGMVRIMRVPCGWDASFGVPPCSGGSPTAGPLVTLGEARGWGLRSQQEVGMHQVSALGASQGVF